MNALTIADRSIRRDADGRYCVNDLHKAAGAEPRHRPAYWLGLDQTEALAAEIEKAGNPAISTKQRIGTFVARELVYAYAMWISPAFHLAVIRSFDAMVSGNQNPDVNAALQNAAYTAARKAGDLERAAELHDDDRLHLRGIYTAADKQMRAVNQRIRRVTSDRALSAEAKGELLAGLHQTRDRLARHAVERARAREMALEAAQ